MSDIFISYARADRARVAPLVAALEAQGWSVWWDPEITPGQEFDRQISDALDAAKAVIVVWTPNSVDSRWVRGEAREAADRRVLVPVRFENARLPIDARAMHTTDLDAWKEDRQGRPFQDLSRALRALIGAERAGERAAVERREPAAEAAVGISVCVLPFANMSADAEQEYFADGISEDIITDLSKVSALSVIARNSAFAFKGKHADLLQVAKQLKVSHILEGSVRKSGNRVRITAQLIDGSTNGHIWAERYDRSLDDIFALQDEISQAIVAALKLKLLPEEKKAIEDRGTDSLEAYDKCLRAQALATSALAADAERAQALYREALAIDPHLTRAWAGLCTLAIMRLVYAPQKRAETLTAMEQMVGEALAVAPDDKASHLANCMLLTARHDWLGADAAFEKARTPAASDYVLCTVFLGGVGRIAEATRELTRSRDADPLWLTVSSQLQQALYAGGRAADAKAEYERTLSLTGAREPMEQMTLMRIWDSGDMPRVKLQFRRYLDCQVNPVPVLNRLEPLIERPADSLALIRDALDDPGNQDSTTMMLLSWHAARFGDAALAVAFLRRAYLDLGGIHLLGLWFPVLAEARKTPGFKAIVRELGLADYWRKSGKWGDFARPLGDDDFEVIG